MSNIIEVIMHAIDDFLISLIGIFFSTYLLSGLISIILVILLFRKVSKQQEQIISLATGLKIALLYIADTENSENNLEIVKKFYYQNFIVHTVEKEETKVFCSNCGAMNLPEEKTCFECNFDLENVNPEKKIMN